MGYQAQSKQAVQTSHHPICPLHFLQIELIDMMWKEKATDRQHPKDATLSLLLSRGPGLGLNMSPSSSSLHHSPYSRNIVDPCQHA